jgi:thiol-disulfide isomerase/thioredoxin
MNVFAQYKKPLLGVFVALVIVGSILWLESRKVDIGGSVGNQDIVVQNESERVAGKEREYERVKEISTPNAFINTENITISELIGEKVILVDFWTYSCINCQRTIPFLNAWHEKYEDDGLVILGIHTPEFEFEEEYENVRRAVEKFDIEYPVVLDNDYSTWRSYKNRYWPRKYLIDIDGFIVYDHIGEGAYEETEEKIVELLNERSEVLGGQRIVREEGSVHGVDMVNFDEVRSPEMYLGHGRIEYIANLPSPGCFDRTCDYASSGDPRLNTFVLSGMWMIMEESAQLVGAPGSITLTFSASKVNLVAGAAMPVRAEVYLDGVRIDTASGTDVVDGSVTFGSHDLYNLVDLGGKYSEHTLEIRFLEEGISAFAFTFG